MSAESLPEILPVCVPDFQLLNSLFQLQLRNQVDPRTIACHVTAHGDDKRVVISGFSQFRQTDEFVRTTALQVFAPAEVMFDLRVLTKAHALAFHEVVTVAAPFYKEPVISQKDLLTEALYGTMVRTYFSRYGFTFAQHPDGYVGYVPSVHLRKTTV